MTKLPLPLLLQPPAGGAATQLRSFLPPARRLAAMSAEAKTAPVSGEYPSPVSPPYPAASKDVELRRAMTASARSAVLASADVVFEDEWLAVVNKPAGVYCDAVLTALPRSAASGEKEKVIPSELREGLACKLWRLFRRVTTKNSFDKMCNFASYHWHETT